MKTKTNPTDTSFIVCPHCLKESGKTNPIYYNGQTLKCLVHGETTKKEFDFYRKNKTRFLFGECPI